MSIGEQWCQDRASEMSFWTTNSRKGKMEISLSSSGAHDTLPPSGTGDSRLWGAGLWRPSMGLLPVSRRYPPKYFWIKLE